MSARSDLSRGIIDCTPACTATTWTTGVTVKDILRTLKLPRWQLALRLLMVVAIVALTVRLGIYWGFVVPVGLLVMWGLYYDYSHKPRGGWRPAPMGSFAVVNNVDPSFLISERGDSTVDATGRTFQGSSRVPTPEEQAAMGTGSWDGLLWVVAELVVLAVLFLLVVQIRH
jgi:hypothetical protein